MHAARRQKTNKQTKQLQRMANKHIFLIKLTSEEKTGGIGHHNLHMILGTSWIAFQAFKRFFQSQELF